VALDYYRQCEAIYSVRGTQRHRAMVSYWIGETLYLLGDLAGAEQELAESLRHGRAIGSLLIVTRRLALLALVHLESGGGEQVADMLRESIALSIQLDNRLELGILLIGCARLALHRGGHRRAATLLGAAEERFAAIDLEPDDVCARARRITLDALAETLSEAEAADALRQGRGLTLAQALALAGADLGPIG
jgi:hypothetical protein